MYVAFSLPCHPEGIQFQYGILVSPKPGKILFIMFLIRQVYNCEYFIHRYMKANMFNMCSQDYSFIQTNKTPFSYLEPVICTVKYSISFAKKRIAKSIFTNITCKREDGKNVRFSSSISFI